jgi:Calcineurin-like phosphoesterase
MGTDAMNSIATVAQSESSFYLAMGDLSYQAGGEQEWCTTFKTSFNDVELIAGNHDSGESPGGHIDNYRIYCPYTLATSSLVGDYGKQYYFDYPQDGTPSTRFIMITPGVKGTLNIDYTRNGEGYAFTKNAIDDARERGIKWIVIGMHKNCISAGAKPCEAGTDLMNLLIQEKVDLILQGHDHNYQRSHQLRCLKVNSADLDCIADKGDDGIYTKGAGPVILINGEFGISHYSVSASDSEARYFAKIDRTTFGVTKYVVTDTEINATYLRSGGGSHADSFRIVDNAEPTPTPDPDAPTLTPRPVLVTTVLNPIADASAKSDQPAANFGSATTLESDGSPVYVAYMKYDLSSISGHGLVSAKLRMRVSDSSASIQNIKNVADSSWTESGLTYDNRPALGSVIGTFPGRRSGSFVEIDVTPGLANKSGRLVSLAIDSTGEDGYDFYSRNRTADKVSLVLTLHGSGSPLVTTAPTPTQATEPTQPG